MKIIKFSILILILAGCATPRFGNDPKAANLNFLVRKAEKASREDNYIKSAQCYVDAILEAEEVAPEHVPTIKSELASVYLDWARSLYWSAKQNHSAKSCYRAINMAERAAEIDPKREVRCRLLIDKLKKELASIKYKNATDLDTLDPDNKVRSMKIALLCKQGAVFIESQQYTRARDKYEEVLIIDPYNLDAIRGLKKVMKELKKSASKRRAVSEAERMAEIEWNYVQAVAEKEKESQGSQLDKELPVTLKDKLNSYIIKGINFQDLPLDQVFSILEKEISIALNNNFKFEFKDFSPADKKLPPVTFKVSEIPADEAVKVICDGMNLDFQYGKDKIVILPLKNQ